MIKLTPEIWDHIERVNKTWNDKILYESDSAHYGKKEWWRFPYDDIGDCEDFAIAKRQALLSFDIPGFFATCWTRPAPPKPPWPSWLNWLLGPVQTKNQGYHGVLVIDTDQGDYVLSNGFDTVYTHKQLTENKGWKWHKRETENGIWLEVLA